MELVDSILGATLAILGILGFYNIVLLVIGVLFPPRTFKPTVKLHKFAIMISARNEEKVIAQLLDSIRKQNYPAHKLTVFVVAHNCTDKTAARAKEAGAAVYEFNNEHKPKEKRKGFALKYLLEQIRHDYATTEQPNGIKSFDGFFVFDADNLLVNNFIAEVNKAFADMRFDYFTSYLSAKNFGSTFISAYSSMGYYAHSCNNARPRSLLGLSVKRCGLGVCYRSQLLENGWKWLTLTEDSEFIMNMNAKGHRGTYIEAAELFDEQPLSLNILVRQRMRWTKGMLVAYIKNFPRILAGIFFSKGIHRRLSNYDNLIMYFPVWALSFIYGMLYPIAAVTVSFTTGSGYTLTTMLTNVATFFTGIYIYDLVNNALTIIREHRRIRVPLLKLIRYIFLWPFVTILLQFTNIAAIFWPVKWKPIPHVIGTSIEEIGDEKMIAEKIIKSA